jgi:hypothetical protein
LERYRIGHESYPETLNQLVPEFIKKVPHDLITGEPLKYQRTDGGQYQLYSVGWDEKDNGGTPAITKYGKDESGDWAWSFPVETADDERAK